MPAKLIRFILVWSFVGYSISAYSQDSTQPQNQFQQVQPEMKTQIQIAIQKIKENNKTNKNGRLKNNLVILAELKAYILDKIVPALKTRPFSELESVSEFQNYIFIIPTGSNQKLGCKELKSTFTQEEQSLENISHQEFTLAKEILYLICN